MKETDQPWDWLAGADLSDYIAARKSNWTKKCLAADQFANAEPWKRVVDPELRTYLILLWLQNKQRGAARKREAEELHGLRDQVGHLKKALEDEILQGVTLSLYAQCWAAWGGGRGESVKQLESTIERKRAEWRAKCEIEAKERHKQWMQGNAEILRERAPGFLIPVNWFAPLPIYNHTAHSDHVEWGYSQATGQDRKKVSAFLKAEGQEPIECRRRKGAGRPLPFYGFKTNMLVLDKWLGDWLPNARGDEFKYHDSSKPGKTFIVPGPERVCEAIDRTVWHAAHEQHTDDQARRFLCVLRKHFNRCKSHVKDPDVRRWLPRLAARLATNYEAWRHFVQERRMQWAEHLAKTEAGCKLKHGKWVQGEPKATGPMPYAEIRHAYKRYREHLG